MNEITDEEIREAKQEVKKHYRENTGHELPDHVVENLQYLGGPSLVDVAEIEKRSELERESSKDDTITAPEALFLLGELAVSGFVGLYVSRFFNGWPAQVAGGVLVAMTAFVIMGFTVWWVPE